MIVPMQQRDDKHLIITTTINCNNLSKKYHVPLMILLHSNIIESHSIASHYLGNSELINKLIKALSYPDLRLACFAAAAIAADCVVVR